MSMVRFFSRNKREAKRIPFISCFPLVGKLQAYGALRFGSDAIEQKKPATAATKEEKLTFPTWANTNMTATFVSTIEEFKDCDITMGVRFASSSPEKRRQLEPEDAVIRFVLMDGSIGHVMMSGASSIEGVGKKIKTICTKEVPELLPQFFIELQQVRSVTQEDIRRAAVNFLRKIFAGKDPHLATFCFDFSYQLPSGEFAIICFAVGDNVVIGEDIDGKNFYIKPPRNGSHGSKTLIPPKIDNRENWDIISKNMHCEMIVKSTLARTILLNDSAYDFLHPPKKLAATALKIDADCSQFFVKSISKEYEMKYTNSLAVLLRQKEKINETHLQETALQAELETKDEDVDVVEINTQLEIIKAKKKNVTARINEYSDQLAKLAEGIGGGTVVLCEYQPDKILARQRRKIMEDCIEESAFQLIYSFIMDEKYHNKNHKKHSDEFNEMRKALNGLSNVLEALRRLHDCVKFKGFKLKKTIIDHFMIALAEATSFVHLVSHPSFLKLYNEWQKSPDKYLTCDLVLDFTQGIPKATKKTWDIYKPRRAVTQESAPAEFKCRDKCNEYKKECKQVVVYGRGMAKDATSFFRLDKLVCETSQFRYEVHYPHTLSNVEMLKQCNFILVIAEDQKKASEQVKSILALIPALVDQQVIQGIKIKVITKEENLKSWRGIFEAVEKLPLTQQLITDMRIPLSNRSEVKAKL